MRQQEDTEEPQSNAKLQRNLTTLTSKICKMSMTRKLQRDTKRGHVGSITVWVSCSYVGEGGAPSMYLFPWAHLLIHLWAQHTFWLDNNFPGDTGWYNATLVTLHSLNHSQHKSFTPCLHLLSHLLLSRSADTARQRESDRRRWLCFSINTTAECNHCACDCTIADNWFKKILSLLCLQMMVSSTYSQPSPACNFKHLLLTFPAFFVRLNLMKIDVLEFQFLWKMRTAYASYSKSAPSVQWNLFLAVTVEYGWQ